MRTPFRVALWAALALVLAGGLSVAAFSIAAKDVGNAPTEPIGFTPSPLPSPSESPTPTASPRPTRTPTPTRTHEPTAQPSGGGSTSTSSAPPAPSPSNDDDGDHEGGDD